ncbi:MAG: hypothetical protein ACD_13C00050G0002 [uncultured bacterium]|nr:MAG: hypothetical protein ACD_13C00050G0002 [uncultured bacterium]
MGLNSRKILGINITIDTKDKVLEEIEKGFKTKHLEPRTKDKKIQKPLIIFTPNPEIINFARKDANFKEIVNSAQINIPDGVGISWALKKLYRLAVKRLSGADFMLDLCQLSCEKGFIIGLIGGRGGIAVKTRECLMKKYLGLKVEVFEEPEIQLRTKNLELRTNSQLFINEIDNHRVGRKRLRHLRGGEATTSTPRMVEESGERYFESLTKEIQKKRIDILFVALGFPKQELFINQLKDQQLTTNDQRPFILMAVGGAFDYIAGRTPRAPEWVRKIGLEWLYRLIREPWRLGRQIRGAEFFWRVIYK